MNAYQNLFYLTACGLLFSIRCFFLSAMSKTPLRISGYFMYMTIFYLHYFLTSKSGLPNAVSLFSFLLLSFLYLKFIGRQTAFASLLLTLLLYTTEQLNRGMLAPFQLLFTRELRFWQYYVLMALLFFLFLFLCAAVYFVLARKLDIAFMPYAKYGGVAVLPLLFIILVYQIPWNRYTTIEISGGAVITRSNTTFQENIQIMLLSLSALLCVFASLYAWRKMMSSFQLEKDEALWKQLLDSQKAYTEEAHRRLLQTASIRHDFKNHLAVIEQLLEKEETGEAEKYLKNLHEVTDKLSFSCQTENPVIDALLNNKLSLAKQAGIEIECFVIIPPDGIDVFDLCVIFSNALDNAVTACREAAGARKFIRLSTRRKGNFFMIEMENSIDPHAKKDKPEGQGILNMRMAAEKYQGTVQIEKNTNAFHLSILLVLPEQKNDI